MIGFPERRIETDIKRRGDSVGKEWRWKQKKW